MNWMGGPHYHPATLLTLETAPMTTRSAPMPRWLCAGPATLAVLALAACGGSDDSSPGGSAKAGVSRQAVAEGTLQGVVIAAGALQGATVCLDLDANGACDA